MTAVNNPSNGDILPVKAGDALDLVLQVRNDNPYQQAAFYFDTDLPDEWWKGPSESDPVVVAAVSSSSCVFTLRPSAGAQIADYPFRLRIVVKDDVATVPPDTSFVLRVEKPVAEAVPESVPEPAAPPEEKAAVEPKPEATPAKRRSSSQAKPVKAEPTAEPEPQEPSAAEQTPPVTTEHYRDGIVTGTVLAAEPVAPPPPVVPPDVDKQAIDPENMQTLYLRPGESMLVRFRFHNTESFACNYILDQDPRISLPQGWLDRLQGQVNITPNAEGEVFCLIRPPANARPSEYPFALFVGPQHGGREPEERTLTLRVQATPAVKLTAPKPLLKAGPVARSADFPLVVGNAGNAETAFRVAVISPESVDEGSGDQQEEREIYESANWTYHFDKELDSLKSTVAGRDPEPRSVRLRLRRRGAWWWGFREQHTANVAAVPVTDATNAGRNDNTAEVTVQRWRLLPFPYVMVLPIVLLLFMLAGRAGNLRVTNGLQVPSENRYYVLSAEPLVARIAWDAPFLMPQRLVFDDGHAETRFDHRSERSIELGGGPSKYGKTISCGVKGQNITITVLPSRAAELVVNGPGLVKLESGSERVGSDRVEVSSALYELPVPTVGYTSLTFKNVDLSGTQISIHPFAKPSGSAFEVFNMVERSPESGKETQPIKIRALSPDAEGEIVFVTTDSKQQIIRIRLRAQ